MKYSKQSLAHMGRVLTEARNTGDVRYSMFMMRMRGIPGITKRQVELKIQQYASMRPF